MSLLFTKKNHASVIDQLNSMDINEINQYFSLSTAHQIDILLQNWAPTIPLSIVDGLARNVSARAKQFLCGSSSNNIHGVQRQFYLEVTEKGAKEGVILETWENHRGRQEKRLEKGIYALDRDKAVFLHHRYGPFAPVDRRQNRVKEVSEEMYFEQKYKGKGKK